MLDNIKVKPLNEDPNKILELLNKNKRNLEALAMQYDGIIEWYIELLGSKYWGKPNSNEIVLPEIIKMLETYNYDCEFTETGIYQEGQPIFTLEEVDYYPVKVHEIHIKNGIDRIEISGGKNSLINGQRGVVLRKKIYDFFKLDNSEMSTLSNIATLQIENPRIAKDMELKSIYMISNIAEGVELNRTVLEKYQSIQNSNESHEIYTVYSYNTDEPTISAIVYNDPKYEIDMNMESGDNKLTFGPYNRANPDPKHTTEQKSFYNYGESKLTLGNSVNLEPRMYKLPIINQNPSFENGADRAEAIDREKNYYYEDYDYERLLANIQLYQRKYPGELHPLLTRTYIDNWKTEFGETVSYYLKKKLFPDKCIEGQ